jgi:hypothetical protein
MQVGQSDFTEAGEHRTEAGNACGTPGDLLLSMTP